MNKYKDQLLTIENRIHLLMLELEINKLNHPSQPNTIDNFSVTRLLNLATMRFADINLNEVQNMTSKGFQLYGNETYEYETKQKVASTLSQNSIKKKTVKHQLFHLGVRKMSKLSPPESLELLTKAFTLLGLYNQHKSLVATFNADYATRFANYIACSNLSIYNQEEFHKLFSSMPNIKEYEKWTKFRLDFLDKKRLFNEQLVQEIYQK